MASIIREFALLNMNGENGNKFGVWSWGKNNLIVFLEVT